MSWRCRPFGASAAAATTGTGGRGSAEQKMNSIFTVGFAAGVAGRRSGSKAARAAPGHPARRITIMSAAAFFCGSLLTSTSWPSPLRRNSIRDAVLSRARRRRCRARFRSHDVHRMHFASVQTERSPTPAPAGAAMPAIAASPRTRTQSYKSSEGIPGDPPTLLLCGAVVSLWSGMVIFRLTMSSYRPRGAWLLGVDRHRERALISAASRG